MSPWQDAGEMIFAAVAALAMSVLLTGVAIGMTLKAIGLQLWRIAHVR